MIEESEYKKRREVLAKKLKKNSITLLFSATQKIRSNDTEFPYRQESNFYYLTGFKEDNSCLMIIKKRKTTQHILFVAKKDPLHELWNGKRVGVKHAKKIFVYDAIYAMETLSAKLQKLGNIFDTFYYDFKNTSGQTLTRELYAIPTHKNIVKKIQKMRLIKSPAEVELIKKAIAITKEAHHFAMKNARELRYEYELQAGIEYVFKKNGAYSDAYTSIVACDNAANTLHYITNDKPLVDKKLILIDAGCEYKYYASDITRTIPVNGKFTSAQRELYTMVLSVQLEILAMIKPNTKRSDLQKEAVKLLTQGMIKLGILKKSFKKCIKNELYKKYYPHGIGHWMGMDVHDECPYKTKKGKEIPLSAGMVLTIEPGIYLDENDTSIPKKYRGIGIRIEDDVLITQEGCENLSQGIAKTIQEIESI